MPRFKQVAGVGKVQLTSEEETARDAEEAQAIKDSEEYAKVAYKDKRKVAYPEIGDQLDALYHAGVFSKEMADKIKAVKDANPKPE
tara:strand:+ start:12727 stop:12984 length:258 start_codon:yes stop_codon:yes gene_type:complete